MVSIVRIAHAARIVPLHSSEGVNVHHPFYTGWPKKLYFFNTQFLVQYLFPETLGTSWWNPFHFILNDSKIWRAEKCATFLGHPVLGSLDIRKSARQIASRSVLTFLQGAWPRGLDTRRQDMRRNRSNRLRGLISFYLVTNLVSAVIAYWPYPSASACCNWTLRRYINHALLLLLLLFFYSFILFYFYFLTPVLNSRGMKKITEKYKNQAGMNLTPPPPSQNSHALRWHCTAESERRVAEIK